MKPEGEGWIKADVAAKMLGVREDYVKQLVSRGELAKWEGNKKPFYYRIEEVERLAREPERVKRLESRESAAGKRRVLIRPETETEETPQELAGVPRLALEPARYRGALEIHIEQGTQLERGDLRIGIVTGIVAIRHFSIVFEGQQDHTGGTTMAERRDAALSAVRLLAVIDTEFPKVCGERSVWTTGRIVVEPNQPMIIPGRAELSFSFRDLSEAVMDRMEVCLRALVRESNRRERCPVTIDEISRLKPELCDDAITGAFEAAAQELCPGAWQTMQSGALHDSQVLARQVPVGILFVPSIGGISHHWTEDTKREDLELGCLVMAAAAERLLAR